MLREQCESVQMTNRSLPRAFSSYQPFSQRVYGCICLSKSGKLLVVKERLGQKWSLPKGHIHTGEVPEACALREMYEETGIHLPSNGYSEYKKFAEGFGGYFIYRMEEELPTNPQDTQEIDTAAWIDVSEIDYRHSNCDLRCCCRWLQFMRRSCSV